MPGTAVVVIDVLNPYEHGDADRLAASMEDLVRRALDGRRPDLVEPLRPPDGCEQHRRAEVVEATACLADRAVRSA